MIHILTQANTRYNVNKQAAAPRFMFRQISFTADRTKALELLL